MTQGEPRPPTAEPTDAPARLHRSTTDKMVAGVCGGLGQYFGVDPIWFRLGFVVTTLIGGTGLIIYVVAWIVLPAAAPGDETTAGAKGIGPEGSVIAGVALVGIGLMLLANTFLPWFGKVVWPLAVVIAGVGLIYIGTRNEQR